MSHDEAGATQLQCRRISQRAWHFGRRKGIFLLMWLGGSMAWTRWNDRGAHPFARLLHNLLETIGCDVTIFSSGLSP